VLRVAIVLNAGDDEQYLWNTLKIPDNDLLRQAVDSVLTPGVWPTHE
jgi:hypothetical protein